MLFAKTIKGARDRQVDYDAYAHVLLYPDHRAAAADTCVSAAQKWRRACLSSFGMSIFWLKQKWATFADVTHATKAEL